MCSIKDKEERKYWRELRKINKIPQIYLSTNEIDSELRSQIKNKEKAFKILKTRLYDLKLREKEEEEGEIRRSKIGTGDRSEKIRTYNYPQNRITDHRINFTIMELDRVMEGNLDPVIEALINEDQRLKLLGDTNE